MHSVGARANSRKFQLTVRFLREARRSGSASLAETLNILSDTFWSSHMTRHHYQSPLLTPVVVSFSLKFTFIFFLSVSFPVLAFFLALVLMADSLLLLLCMS